MDRISKQRMAAGAGAAASVAVSAAPSSGASFDLTAEASHPPHDLGPVQKNVLSSRRSIGDCNVAGRPTPENLNTGFNSCRKRSAPSAATALR